jgi:hypothetical protein
LKPIIVAGLLFAFAGAASAEPALKPETAKAVETAADHFFGLLKSGDVDKAYTDLFDPEMSREKGQAIANLASQNSTAIKLYGAISGWDQIDHTSISPYLVRVRYELRLQRLPLFYTLTFYRKDDAAPWVVIKSYFTDNDADTGAGGG